jgi:hypothetical protein
MWSQSIRAFFDDDAAYRLTPGTAPPGFPGPFEEVRPLDGVTAAACGDHSGDDPIASCDADLLAALNPTENFTQVMLDLSHACGFHVSHLDAHGTFCQVIVEARTSLNPKSVWIGDLRALLQRP